MKKIRPNKPLPKITRAEIPFEIPKDWEWCHFGEVIRAYEAGSSFKCDDREVTGLEWGVIKTSAVTSGTFVERQNKFLSKEEPSDTSAQVKIGDLIFCRASGSKGLAGMCAIVRDCSRNLLLFSASSMSAEGFGIGLRSAISHREETDHDHQARTDSYAQ